MGGILLLLLPLPSCHQFLHLSAYFFVGDVGVNLADVLLEVGEVLTDHAGALLLRLCLLDVLDGLLDLGVRFLEHLLRLLLGMGDDDLALVVQFLDVLLISLDGLLHLLLVLMDALALLFPVALVAHDVLQVFVGVDVVLAHDLAGILDHLVGDAGLAGNLDGERTAGVADGELEEGLHELAVVEHGAVHNALRFLGIVLQVLVVGGDDAERMLLVEDLQHRFRHRTANLRFRAATELVDEDETLPVAMLHHVLHVQQVGRVGREVVLQALLVADVDEDAPEDAEDAALRHRHRHAALEHVLQQSHRLQTHRLAASVRTRDEQDALLLRQRDVERNHLARLLLLMFYIIGVELQFQQRMHGNRPVQQLLVLHAWLRALRDDGELRLGADEVDLCQELIASEHVLHLGTDCLRELHQDAVDLLPLLTLQLADLVVRLHHLGRFDKDRPARVRLVMHDATDLSLHRRSHRDDQSAVAQGGGYVLVDESLAFCRAEDVLQGSRHTACRRCQLLTNAEQCRRRRVLHMTELVEDLVDALHHLRIGLHLLGQCI